ncbi:MAG: UrcA family protein [Pseudomonadota bacterium]
MRTSMIAGAVCAIALAPAGFAAAQPTEVTLVFEYEVEALSTPAGAQDVLTDLESQARVACKRSHTMEFASRIDESCVDDLMAKAISAIRTKWGGSQELAGLFGAPSDLVLAELKQR